MLLLFIWAVKITSLLVLGTSLIGFLGVALFASWCFLSNITAAVILFLASPYGIGDEVSFTDGGTLREGVIDEMTLFYIYIKDSDSTRVSVPNNMMLQRSVRVHDKPEDGDPKE